MNIKINLYKVIEINVKGFKYPYCKLQLVCSNPVNKLTDGIKFLNELYKIPKKTASSALRYASASITNRSSCMKCNKDGTCIQYVIEILI